MGWQRCTRLWTYNLSFKEILIPVQKVISKSKNSWFCVNLLDLEHLSAILINKNSTFIAKCIESLSNKISFTFYDQWHKLGRLEWKIKYFSNLICNFNSKIRIWSTISIFEKHKAFSTTQKRSTNFQPYFMSTL